MSRVLNISDTSLQSMKWNKSLTQLPVYHDKRLHLNWQVRNELHCPMKRQKKAYSNSGGASEIHCSVWKICWHGNLSFTLRKVTSSNICCTFVNYPTHLHNIKTWACCFDYCTVFFLIFYICPYCIVSYFIFFHDHILAICMILFVCHYAADTHKFHHWRTKQDDCILFYSILFYCIEEWEEETLCLPP